MEVELARVGGRGVVPRAVDLERVGGRGIDQHDRRAERGGVCVSELGESCHPSRW